MRKTFHIQERASYFGIAEAFIEVKAFGRKESSWVLSLTEGSLDVAMSL